MEKQRYRAKERAIHKQTDSLSCCHSDVRAGLRCELWVALALTFLLPSVTVRGTGMGGHLLRLGGGFSLFQRMMIWSARKGRNFTLGWSDITQPAGLAKVWFLYVLFAATLYLILHLRAVFWLGDHLKQLHDWLRLGDQWGHGMDDSSELLTWSDPWTRSRKNNYTGSARMFYLLEYLWGAL